MVDSKVSKRKPGRKSDQERAEIRLANAKLARYEKQEAKRATRLQIDTNGSLLVSLSLAAIALITSFVVSYSTLVAVAEWMRLEWEPLNWVVPGFIEVLILFSTYDFLITRSRGGTGRVPLWSMIGFSVVAVIANAAHSYQAWQADGELPWFAWIGVGLSAIVPFVVVYISKRLSGLVFAEVIEP